MTTTYEEQLAIVQDLIRPTSDKARNIVWCVPGGPIGLARTPKGFIEIFLEGPELHARYRRVRDALEYQRWFRAEGTQLLASRILLPAAGHFEQVAAFLCTELLRNGALTDLRAAFAQTEPLIDLGIDDLIIADEAFIGLCGEMMLLEALVRLAPVARVDQVVDSWKGFRETARDFQLPWVGVEVKTTTGSTSSHAVSGVQQLEIGHGVDNAEESDFVLASLGLEWSEEGDAANSVGLPEVIDGVLDRVSRAAGPSAGQFADDLLDHISEYGAPTAIGYDLRTMRDSARFNRLFRLRFARGYDMTDPAIRLLTTDDLRARPFIDGHSLRIRVNLPDQVRGDLNPVVGLTAVALEILDLSSKSY